jgi:hypothetical protein
METELKTQPECCPKFDPIPWDDKTFEWENKKFVKDKVFTLFYIPMNFGKVMKRFDEKLTQAGAKMPENLGLSEHTSKWNMDLYLAVDKEIPNAENVNLSGKFYSKVYEGSFNDTGKWMKNFENTAKNKELSIKKEYIWYTTCPKCAKKYGKNYVTLIGQMN